MLKTLAAIVAVSAMLQVVSAAYKCVVTCGKTSVKLDVQYLKDDPAMKVAFISDHLNDADCKTTDVVNPTAAPQMTLTVNDKKCGFTKPTGTGAETKSLTLFAAVDEQARNFKKGDIYTFDITCKYQDGELTGESTKPVTINGEPQLEKGTVETAEPVIADPKVYKPDGTTEVTTGKVGDNILVKTDASSLTTLTSKCICSKVVMKATPSATDFYLATDDRCSKMVSKTSNAAVKVESGEAKAVTCQGLTLALMQVQKELEAGKSQPVTIEITVKCCSGGTLCDTKTDCPSFRKKRSAYDEKGVTILKANTTVTIVEERPQRQGQEACAGYTSNTVFYVVVVVLAVLLVITIGVAAYFGTRARVVVAGKDNPVFG